MLRGRGARCPGHAGIALSPKRRHPYAPSRAARSAPWPMPAAGVFQLLQTAIATFARAGALVNRGRHDACILLWPMSLNGKDSKHATATYWVAYDASYGLCHDRPDRLLAHIASTGAPRGALPCASRGQHDEARTSGMPAFRSRACVKPADRPIRRAITARRIASAQTLGADRQYRPNGRDSAETRGPCLKRLPHAQGSVPWRADCDCPRPQERLSRSAQLRSRPLPLGPEAARYVHRYSVHVTRWKGFQTCNRGTLCCF